MEGEIEGELTWVLAALAEVQVARVITGLRLLVAKC